MTIPVKWFTHAMIGAPAPSSAIGTLTSLLDACLINGFNVQTVDSLTYDSATGKCTATVNAGHGYTNQQVLLIAGADQAEYNGEVRCELVDAQQFRYVPDAAPSVATATGVITAKAAPVGGWEISFTAADKRVYRSTDPLATGQYLRVDDSIGTDGAQVTAYEAMTDVDTGTGQWADGYWRKADANRSMDEWALVGDSRGFYFMLGGGSGAARCIHWFGDVESFVAGDGYHCALTFDTAASGGTMNAAGCVTAYGAQAGHDLWRRMDGMVSPTPWEPHGVAKVGIYPDAATGGIVALPGPFIYEPQSGSWRGRFPGCAQLLTDAHMLVEANHLCLRGAKYVAIALESWR